MKQFPYTAPNSPESKYYVQLESDFPSNQCQYGTYWKYGNNNLIRFHHIDSMIHSTNFSADEDYWYSNVTCRIDSEGMVPCEQIYFKKNTEIPLRVVRVVRNDRKYIQTTTNYTIISIGKPDEQYFNVIPKNWSIACRDVNLGVLYSPQSTKINLNKSSKIRVRLSTPAHQINRNDTVRIQWNATQCTDCFSFSPKRLVFNINDFQDKQILTISRVKKGTPTTLIPSFIGGGFELVSPQMYPIYIQ